MALMKTIMVALSADFSGPFLESRFRYTPSYSYFLPDIAQATEAEQVKISLFTVFFEKRLAPRKKSVANIFFFQKCQRCRHS